MSDNGCIIYDFETGIKTEPDPPCECEDGHGTSSNPFPWVTAIRDAEGFCFIRVQTGHDHFIDVGIDRKQAGRLVSILGSFLAQ